MSTSEENNKMTAQALALEEFDQHKDQRETVDVFFDAPGNEALDEEQIYRASAYGLIAALLRSAPDQDMLERLTGLSPGVVPEGDEL
ncbi:MAG: hypothetical protein O6649_09550, partial [Gammaproteobacteria bacterium]|nr:hypothetical protein [Gammaproteobacteria bacterium]